MFFKTIHLCISWWIKKILICSITVQCPSRADMYHVCRVQPTRCNISRFIYFCKTPYMFQTVFLSIIMSSKLHLQRRVLVWQIPDAVVQFWAPDDGRKNRMKHVVRRTVSETSEARICFSAVTPSSGGANMSNALPGVGVTAQETCWSCFNVNFNVNFKNLFKTIHLCISWWIKKILICSITVQSESRADMYHVCRVQPTKCNISRFIYFCKTPYMFQTVFPSIIMSSKLHIQCRVLVWQIPDAVRAVLSSWWWTEKPYETRRASYRNK